MDVWVPQRASPSGWFDRATHNEALAKKTRDAVLDVMEETAKRICTK
jgi:hypothetical protein